MFSQVFDTLRRYAEKDTNTTVQNVKVDAFYRRSVILREEGLVLYAPASETENYEILLQQPVSSGAPKAFSLLRCPDLNETKMKMCSYTRNILPLMEACPREFGYQSGIQKLCDVLAQHPSWSPSHIAIHLGLVECIKHPSIAGNLNDQEEEQGHTPLHLAIIQKDLRLVNALMGAEVRTDIVNHNHDSVYHVAATTTKDIVQAVCMFPSPLVNQGNIVGLSPLHLACLNDNPDCVLALLRAGSDVNLAGNPNVSEDQEMATPTTAEEVITTHSQRLYTKDMKLGGTPLHWCKSRDVIIDLIKAGCKIDANNFKGETALHVMVGRERLECVVTLLSYGANVDAVCGNGNTPLHIAVTQGLSTITQALLVFGANLNMLNAAGNTARHLVANIGSLSPADKSQILYLLHAVGAPRCPSRAENCSDGCAVDGMDNGIPPDRKFISRGRAMLDSFLENATNASASANPPQPSTKRCRLLSLDGGGIRGLVLLQMLLYMEELLDRPIKECFDWIAGTSAGAAAALVLAEGKPLRSCQGIYFRMRNEVFVGLRPYDSSNFEKFLKETLEEDVTMADLKGLNVFVTGVMADRYPAELHLFRNYRSPAEELGVESKDNFQPTLKAQDQMAWKAARCSGAAPTYFSASGRFVDGGLISNNPTLDLLTEVFELNTVLRATGQGHRALLPTIVVSLGTGKPPIEEIKCIDTYKHDSWLDTARMVIGITSLGKILVDQATATEGRVVDRARAWCSSLQIPLLRLNPQLSADIAMDETSDQVLINMMWETQAYIRSKKEEIQALAKFLL